MAWLFSAEKATIRRIWEVQSRTDRSLICLNEYVMAKMAGQERMLRSVRILKQEAKDLSFDGQDIAQYVK